MWLGPRRKTLFAWRKSRDLYAHAAQGPEYSYPACLYPGMCRYRVSKAPRSTDTGEERWQVRVKEREEKETHGAMTALASGMGGLCPSIDAGTCSNHPSSSSESTTASAVYQDPAWSAARVPLRAIALDSKSGERDNEKGGGKCWLGEACEAEGESGLCAVYVVDAVDGRCRSYAGNNG